MFNATRKLWLFIGRERGIWSCNCGWKIHLQAEWESSWYEGRSWRYQVDLCAKRVEGLVYWNEAKRHFSAFKFLSWRSHIICRQISGGRWYFKGTNLTNCDKFAKSAIGFFLNMISYESNFFVAWSRLSGHIADIISPQKRILKNLYHISSNITLTSVFSR